MRPRLTILVVARDAAATIERSIRSCSSENCPIILVDDHSVDDTVARARAISGARLTVLSTAEPGGVGMARQCALDAVDTEFAAWLDADDAWIPGRADRLQAMLRSGHDVATESIDLHDGLTDALLRRLTVPSFVQAPRGAVRLFERNFLPGDTQVAFRTQAFRDAGGYDPMLCGPESFDVLLRALRGGARFAFGDSVGYRMYAYPNSVSRNLTRQRLALVAALRKHDYAAVHQLYLAHGYDERLAAWALVIMAQFRDEPRAALTWLESASPADANSDEVLESDGPWPFPEGWRRAFHRGTILLRLEGREMEAAEELRRAEALLPTAEGANNRGVALARLGRRSEAVPAFAVALTRQPGYLDATLNLAAAAPDQVTTHPLRRTASRMEYVA
jgi:glycosyltransferase involved in cell wall biosynthesis